MKNISSLMKKTRSDSTSTKYTTKNGELQLIPRYKRDKNFPKTTISKYIPKDTKRTVKSLRKSSRVI